jgi:hypothetical protein
MVYMDYVWHATSLKNIIIGGVETREPWSMTIKAITS